MNLNTLYYFLNRTGLIVNVMMVKTNETFYEIYKRKCSVKIPIVLEKNKKYIFLLTVSNILHHS